MKSPQQDKSLQQDKSHQQDKSAINNEVTNIEQNIPNK